MLCNWTSSVTVLTWKHRLRHNMQHHISRDLQLLRKRTHLRGISVLCAVQILQIRLNLCSTYVPISNLTRSKRHLSIRVVNKEAILQRPNWSPVDWSILRDYAARIILPVIMRHRFVSYHSTSSLLHFDQNFCIGCHAYCDCNEYVLIYNERYTVVYFSININGYTQFIVCFTLQGKLNTAFKNCCTNPLNIA